MACFELASMLKSVSESILKWQLEVSESDDEAFLQVLYNTIELNAGVNEHIWSSIEPEVAPAGWAGVYNTWFHTLSLENSHLPAGALIFE
jgi:hypothetical protein